ncbi:hypothetical protein [Sorangium sp. So ce1151]|uniref:hypothetical protein n=1 Tax=Sorangium sp. So ce1151 TaxID=3133332 RepID=UPI003F61563E
MNTWVCCPPFVWLPAVMVMAALFGHVVVARRLRAERRVARRLRAERRVARRLRAERRGNVAPGRA